MPIKIVNPIDVLDIKVASKESLSKQFSCLVWLLIALWGEGQRALIDITRKEPGAEVPQLVTAHQISCISEIYIAVHNNSKLTVMKQR